MDILEFIKKLDRMSLGELQDYLESYWRGDFKLTPQEEWHLVERIRGMKTDEVEKYTMIYLVLLALVAIDGDIVTPITSIFSKLSEPELPEEYDLIWVARSDACELCAPLHGKIYGRDFTLKPKLHPNCRCRLKKVKRVRRSMNKIRILEAGAVRAIEKGGSRRLEVLAAPFGSPSRKDKLGQFLSTRTDFMLEIGDRRPLLYMHGFSPRKRAMDKPKSIGVATVTRVDDQGLWMFSDLDDSELANRTWKAALEGNAKASTGSVNYLERHNEVTGEVLCWPIAELSVFDAGENRIPVSDDAVVLPLRVLFDEQSITLPDNFEAGEDKKKNRRDKRNLDKKDKNMLNELDIKQLVATSVAEIITARDVDEKEKADLKDAMRAEIKLDLKAELEKEYEAELKKEKEDPKYRATFNIGGKESKRGLEADAEEEEAFLWNMMNPTQAPRSMVLERGKDAKRVLEESEAAEGASLIPTPVLNKINALRQEYSLVDKLGIEKTFTDSLTIVVPREDAGSAVFPTVAEEGAYVANEPAYSGTTATVVKKGSMITATEELLEDSTIWEGEFYRSMATWWAMTENLELFTKLKATSTAGLHSATWTAAEVDTVPYVMTEPWSAKTHVIMQQATAATIRGLLVATPRAYGGFSDFNDLYNPKFFGIPAHLNSNWEALGSGDTNLIMSHVNPDALSYVERRGLSIKVDPYGDSANGRIRYFPSYRAVCNVIQVLGNVDWTDHA